MDQRLASKDRPFWVFERKHVVGVQVQIRKYQEVPVGLGKVHVSLL